MDEKNRAGSMVKLSVFLAVLFAGFGILVSAARAEDAEALVKDAAVVSKAFEHAAKVIMPSLANISSVQKVTRRVNPRSAPPGMGGDPFHDFFGEEFFDRYFGEQGPQQFRQGGMGSGFVLDSAGHILTNNHVVSGADTVQVKLHDGRTFKAEVVGSDPGTDLALLKIKADRLVPAKLGDSDKLHIGEWVVAAGNPFGLDHTITTGIVSAKGRSLGGSMQYEDFIQTDAAINPGNSGGPLVNLNGEVVGINSAIFTRSGGYMGIGFAIPVNMAQTVVSSLLEHGRVVRGWLGVTIQNLTEDLAQSFGYAGREGVLVGDVLQDGPAAKSDLQSGDLIVRFDGKGVTDVNQLRNMVAATAPKSSVAVEVIRSGKSKTLKVKLGELESDKLEEPAASTPSNELGMELQSLTPELAQRLNAATDFGVVVAGIVPFGSAASAGLRRGDIIISVQGRGVKTVAEFQRELSKSDLKKGARLVVETEGMRRFVMLKQDE